MPKEIDSAEEEALLIGPHPRVLGFELEFTETYQRNLEAHPAVREAACLQLLVPHLLGPIRPGDLFAGRIERYPLVGLGLEQTAGGPGYYCDEEGIRRRMAVEPVGEDEQEQVNAMIDFWQGETVSGRLVGRLPKDLLDATSSPVARTCGRLTGTMINFDKLIRVGLPGLINEVENGLDRALRGRGDPGLYEGMTTALCLLIDVVLHYGNQARDLAAALPKESPRRTELLQLSDNLDHLIVSRPESLAQGIQLTWLYSLVSGAAHHGRMDVYLGDLYARDLDSGRLAEAEALGLLQSFWQMIADRYPSTETRVVMGGSGRRNPAHADRFALAAMEAIRMVPRVMPKLGLRIHRGMSPALKAKALDGMGEGQPSPILFDDDVNVPAVSRAFDVAEAEAAQYCPYGSGRYALAHMSFDLSSGSLNLLKALELTLHNGLDPMSGRPLGLAQGAFRDFVDFESLFTAYSLQVSHFVGYLARRHVMEYEVEDESTAFLFLSMLYDGCLESGRSIVGRGPAYTGGVIEPFGLVNTADSLTAIKQLVYESRTMTPDEMLEALRGGKGPGGSRVRQMRAAPKSGDGDETAAAMVDRVSKQLAGAMEDQADRVDLDFFLVVNTGDSGNVAEGCACEASPDGRPRGAPVAGGKQPAGSVAE